MTRIVLVDGVVGRRGGWVGGGVGSVVELSSEGVGVGGVGLVGFSVGGGGGGDCGGGGGGRGIPHPSSMTGCFQVFFFLRGEAASGVCKVSSTPPPRSILLLEGDILTPLPLPTSRSSCALLSWILVISHSLVSSWLPWLISSSSFFFHSLSSSPRVSLLILLLLNSAFEFRMTSSPHFWMRTASAICLVRALLKYLTGLRWKVGSPSPP